MSQPWTGCFFISLKNIRARNNPAAVEGDTMKRFTLIVTAMALSLAACSDMTATQQRAVTGTGIGAAGGAVIGAIAGNAGLGAGIGAAVGLAGGLIYDKAQKNKAESYRSGYNAGANGYAPNPPH
jgi:Glycine-zipper domain